MSDILKGNFQVKRPVQPAADDDKETLTEELEKKLRDNLGGSVCYVKNKPFITMPKES